MRIGLIAAVVAALAVGSAAQAAELVVNGDFELSSPLHAPPPGVNSYEFGDTYSYGQAVTGWTSTTAPNANAGAFNIYFQPDHAAVNSPGGPISPDTRYTSSEVQYLHSIPGGGSPAGGAFVALDGDINARGIFSQTIDNLIVGNVYHLSFVWAAAQFADRDGNTTEQFHVTFGNEVFNTAVVANLSHQSVGWFNESHDFTATSTSQVLSFLSVGTPTGLPPVALLDGVSLTGSVPEPATWAMLLMGFGGLGALIRRRRAIALA